MYQKRKLFINSSSVVLVQKYPIVWQGLLALKNDQAAVQLHFVSGNTLLAQRSLPPPDGGPLLRIVQRMRLEASQLDSVARRMTVSSLFSMTSEKQDIWVKIHTPYCKSFVTLFCFFMFTFVI